MGRKYNELKTLCERVMLQNEGLIRELNTNVFNPILTCSKNYETMLLAQDQAQCSSRYIWGLPTSKLTSQQLESLLYNWGSLCLFENDKGEIQFARYAQTGQLNEYGYLDEVQPIDFAGRVYDRKRAVISAQKPAVGDVCVILQDYTTFTPITEEISRRALNLSTTIRDEALVYQQLKSNIFLSAKKALAYCENEEQKNQVIKEAGAMLDATNPILAISKSKASGAGSALSDVMEFVNFNNNFDTQNYCQTINFYNKTRRAFNGIPAPDTFEKKERKITAESEDETTHSNLILEDGLRQRQNAINLFKLYCKNPENLKISVRINPILEDAIEAREVLEDE